MNALLATMIHASEGQTLGAGFALPDNNRRSPHEEGFHLNARLSDRDLFCDAQLQHLDRRRRRGQLIGRPGRKPHSEAVSGGSRYSASAFKGLPPHSGGHRG